MSAGGKTGSKKRSIKKLLKPTEPPETIETPETNDEVLPDLSTGEPAPALEDPYVPPKKGRWLAGADAVSTPPDSPESMASSVTSQTTAKTKRKRRSKKDTEPLTLEADMNQESNDGNADDVSNGSFPPTLDLEVPFIQDAPVDTADAEDSAAAPSEEPQTPAEQPKKRRKKVRVIIKEPIDVSTLEDEPEKTNETEKTNSNAEEEEEEEEKVDPAVIDFQIASTSKEYALHTSSGRRTRRIRYVLSMLVHYSKIRALKFSPLQTHHILCKPFTIAHSFQRDPFYEDQDFSDIEDPVDDTDDDEDFTPTRGGSGKNKQLLADYDDDEDSSPRKGRGRGSGRGRGRGKGRGKTKSKGVSRILFIIN